MGHIFKKMYGHTLCSSWLINNVKEKRSKGYLKIVRKKVYPRYLRGGIRLGFDAQASTTTKFKLTRDNNVFLFIHIL